MQQRREFPAIDFNWPEQLTLINELSVRYAEELKELAQCQSSEGFDFENAYFAGFDAAVYYSLIRYLKPAHVIEIGSGYSTQIADKALKSNRQEGLLGKLVCIEPYPEPRLIEYDIDMDLMEKRVEEIDLGLFSVLGENDILFIDSSHSVNFKSDVYCEVLQILPTLKPGVWVQIHDIFFPFDYPADWVLQQRLALNEQYFLEAFLAYSSAFSLRVASCGLCADYQAEAQHLWPFVSTALGQSKNASLWMKRVE